ncbi:Rhodanese-related sulfurtransferase [Evansella caseinilytica]|uniref:Rhodanese-related sulfurtransferase n=1 Tax=Evansella caseinilytica TaxID=1503961 RepID=A0A1H3PMM7_9BACI|nr:rhodanese-like domain-containing protein [Evansella caseinilytica]SDZ02256.1 Rhodanese-related sulfurtransferase [Evansella caseinilytica]
MSFDQDGIKQIDADELKEILQMKEVDTIVIDVREPEEYEASHIPGVPLLPMHSIPLLLDGFDKETEYVFVCRSGNRSQNVAMFMRENGFHQVTNYNGGMLSWDGETTAGPEKHILSTEELASLKRE